MQITCEKGHVYVKTSECRTCPQCERARTKNHVSFSALPAPALRALENAGYHQPSDLRGVSLSSLLSLHGFGPSSLPKLKRILEAAQINWID